MSTIIGIKELHRNLKRVADAALKGASFTVVRDSRPVFQIEPAPSAALRKGGTIENFLKRASFRSTSKNLSKKVDSIVYGKYRPKKGSIERFIARAVRTGDPHLSQKVDDIVYGPRRR